jgi:putative ABC transport system ATP-binding protein
MSEPAIIEVNGLTKTYQVGDMEVHALRGGDLNIKKRREFVAIIGASGSGKSTVFHVLGGLTPATSGNVRINGRDLAGMTNAERTDLSKTAVGFVFQKYNLLPTLSAEDNIRIVQYIADRGTAFDPAFQAILRLLGIADRMKHKPRSLSGGQQRGWQSPGAS